MTKMNYTLPQSLPSREEKNNWITRSTPGNGRMDNPLCRFLIKDDIEAARRRRWRRICQYVEDDDDDANKDSAFI
jgi:hypothetical protein